MGIKRSIFNKFTSKLQNLNPVGFVLVLTSMLFVLAIIFRFSFGSFMGKDIIWFETPFKGENIIIVIISTVIIAPIFETYINQSLPYFLLLKIKYLDERRYLILLISALFFGVTHLYSMFYIFYAFFLGLALMGAYMIRISVDKRAFWLVAISHSIFNLGVVIINL